MGNSEPGVRQRQIRQAPKAASPSSRSVLEVEGPVTRSDEQADHLRAVAEIMEILREGGYHCELLQEIDPSTD
jgi:hypothetical protein